MGYVVIKLDTTDYPTEDVWGLFDNQFDAMAWARTTLDGNWIVRRLKLAQGSELPPSGVPSAPKGLPAGVVMVPIDDPAVLHGFLADVFRDRQTD